MLWCWDGESEGATLTFEIHERTMVSVQDVSLHGFVRLHGSVESEGLVQPPPIDLPEIVYHIAAADDQYAPLTECLDLSSQFVMA